MPDFFDFTLLGAEAATALLCPDKGSDLVAVFVADLTDRLDPVDRLERTEPWLRR